MCKGKWADNIFAVTGIHANTCFISLQSKMTIELPPILLTRFQVKMEFCGLQWDLVAFTNYLGQMVKVRARHILDVYQ